METIRKRPHIIGVKSTSKRLDPALTKRFHDVIPERDRPHYAIYVKLEGKTQWASEDQCKMIFTQINNHGDYWCGQTRDLEHPNRHLKQYCKECQGIIYSHNPKNNPTKPSVTPVKRFLSEKEKKAKKFHHFIRELGFKKSDIFQNSYVYHNDAIDKTQGLFNIPPSRFTLLLQFHKGFHIEVSDNKLKRSFPVYEKTNLTKFSNLLYKTSGKHVPRNTIIDLLNNIGV